MSLRFLLDTNICIYIAKNRPERVLTRFQSLEPGDAAMSAITYGELKYGAFKSRCQSETHKILNELTSMIPVLAIQNWIRESDSFHVHEKPMKYRRNRST
jgi:tRNA(fMet)-specific endonuclease VapC